MWDHDEDGGRVSEDSALTQLTAISSLRWLVLTEGDYPCCDETFEITESGGLVVTAPLFACPASAVVGPGQGGNANVAAARLSVERLMLCLSMSSVDETDVVLEGIAYHVDPATCHNMSTAFEPRHRLYSDSDSEDIDSYVLLSRRLRHLLPATPPTQSVTPFHLTISPLSYTCAAAIDQYYKSTECRIVPVPRSVEQHSTMMSQLAAVRRARPCWADIDPGSDGDATRRRLIPLCPRPGNEWDTRRRFKPVLPLAYHRPATSLQTSALVRIISLSAPSCSF